MKKRYIQEKVYGSPGQYLMMDEDGNLCAGVPDNASYPALLITVPQNCIGVNVYYPVYTKTSGIATLDFDRYIYGTTKKLDDTHWVSTLPNFGLWYVTATLDNVGTTTISEATIDVIALQQYSITIS